jgi:hypothetical protein
MLFLGAIVVVFDIFGALFDAILDAGVDGAHNGREWSRGNISVEAQAGRRMRARPD